jgi:hypothetical protein
MPRSEIVRNMELALQETNHNRELDSLETIIIQTLLTTRGIPIEDGFMPNINTIAGWLEWVEQSSHVQ